MAAPDVPAVSSELWRALLDQLVTFRKAAPWRWIPDSALAAYVDATGQPWFPCVLGHGEEVFGLSLYRGANGLRLCRAVQEYGHALPFSEVRHMQDAVTVWYGTKSDLDPLQRKVFGKVGYAPAANDPLGWPHVRTHRPGFFPWFPDEDEVRVLTAAIPATLRFAEFYRDNPECYDEHGRFDLPSLPTVDAPVRPGDWEWRTWTTPEPDAFGPPVLIAATDPAMHRISSLPRDSEKLEVDWFYTPEPAAEGGRPFYPRCVVVLQESSGYCYGAKVIALDEDVVFVATELILGAIEQHGGRPSLILATKPELAVRLEPLANALGARTKIVKRLKAATEFREGIEERAAGGGREPRKRRGRP